MKFPTRSLAILWLALAAPLLGAPKKIVFISHLSSHGNGQHEYAAGCQLLGKWLTEAYGEDQVTFEHHLIWPENPEVAFQDAATVVFFCSGGNGHLVNPHVKAFDAVMKRGVGLACLHYGVEVPIGPPGKGMLNWMGGYFETHWSVNPHWVAKFDNFPDHPAAAGLEPFSVDDEWYFHMRFRGDMENITPILSAIPPEETMKRGDGPHSGNPAVREEVAAGKPQHVAWTYQRGEDYGFGRGFGFTGLHYHKNLAIDSFRKTVLNGIAWTAKLEVPEGGVPSPHPSEADLAESITATQEKFEAKKEKPAKDKDKDKDKDKESSAAAKKAPGAVYSSTTVTPKTPGHSVDIDVDIQGAEELYLAVTDAGDGIQCDWADWVNPRLVGPEGELSLTELKWVGASSSWGRPAVNKNANGQSLRVSGRAVAKGIGTHADSLIAYKLPQGYHRFRASGALDEGGTRQGDAASVAFHVFTQEPKAFLQALAKKKRRASGEGEALRDPATAVSSLEVHPDLQVDLFAAEPLLLSPSNIDVDHRGRVWVCEVVNYRGNNGKRPEGDRIVILTDTNEDGQADQSAVFYQGHDIDSAHGICVLGSRVIVSANNEVFSLYDDDGDDRADRKEMMFTNIGGSQHDHGIHAFIFGPDGRLYFNFGNAAKRLCDPQGNVIVDLAGNEVTADRRPYQEGMIFRCALDGTQVETLAWNFRNNWEVTVDSFGALWQSDNDDDGNRGVRINFVMEYGNYGYRDEITGAGWQADRIGKHEEIPLMHWHLRDPGVVPNLLQTGAGSPTGIAVYEGTLLPEVFQGEVLHCDAGPNVCRAYPVTPDGAGYTAEVVNILSSDQDRWFRPSDVTVAPDGSLMVADWYDPGVGGHGMGDIERGRIFRVTPKGHQGYTLPALDTSSTEGAMAALRSPNQATRYLGWQALTRDPNGSQAAEDLFADTEAPARHRARGLFLLGWHRQGGVPEGLRDSDPDIRMAALRLARQFDDEVMEAIATLTEDPDPRVRREAAIALRFRQGSRADALWAQLAAQYPAGDRWYLEALGIGADLHWDDRLPAYLALEPGGKELTDILWRSRSRASATLLAAATLQAEDMTQRNRFLRAFHFQPAEKERESALLALFDKGESEVALPVAFMLPASALTGNPQRLQKARDLANALQATAEAVRLIAHLQLEDSEPQLFEFITSQQQPTSESLLAARTLSRRPSWMKEKLQHTDDDNLIRLAQALGATGEEAAVQTLGTVMMDPERPLHLRQKVVEALAKSSRGESLLLQEARQGSLPVDLRFTAAAILGRSRDAEVRAAIAQTLDLPPTPGTESLPPIAELVQMRGQADQGAGAFVKATCATCHQVDGAGINFGPDLSEIGDKLSVEGLYEAILYPNNAISHGFQGVILTLTDDTQLGGYLVSETEDSLSLRMPGGVTQAVPVARLRQRENMEQSLMPPGLSALLSPEELAHLIAYLGSLKKS